MSTNQEPTPSIDKQRLEEYYKLKIKEAFNLFVKDKDKPDYIRKEYFEIIIN